MEFSRRKFLSLIFLSGLLPTFNKYALTSQNNILERKSLLILIELRGGNDGLNTIIPFKDPFYYSQRPNISIHDYLKLNSKLALNPNMKKLMPLFKEKKLTFALGVGWTKPNRSHFKAMDQWSTGNEEGLGKGWLAKISNAIENNQFLLSLGPTGSNAVQGGDVNSLHLIGNENRMFRNLNYENKEIFINRKILQKYTEIDAFSSKELEKVHQRISNLPKEIKIPKGKLSKQTKIALKLINTKNPPPFIQMELSGFDTHQNQINRHNAKLKELSENIYALKRGSEILGKFIDLNIVVTSEFGRRLKENSSLGTDHGSASVAMLIGDSFKDQFIGHYPNLSEVDSRGDLIPNLSPDLLYKYVQNKIWQQRFNV